MSGWAWLGGTAVEVRGLPPEDIAAADLPRLAAARGLSVPALCALLRASPCYRPMARPPAVVSTAPPGRARKRT